MDKKSDVCYDYAQEKPFGEVNGIPPMNLRINDIWN
jgi:hypothetical protein